MLGGTKVRTLPKVNPHQLVWDLSPQAVAQGWQVCCCCKVCIQGRCACVLHCQQQVGALHCLKAQTQVLVQACLPAQNATRWYVVVREVISAGRNSGSKRSSACRAKPYVGCGGCCPLPVVRPAPREAANNRSCHVSYRRRQPQQTCLRTH